MEKKISTQTIDTQVEHKREPLTYEERKQRHYEMAIARGETPEMAQELIDSFF